MAWSYFVMQLRQRGVQDELGGSVVSAYDVGGVLAVWVDVLRAAEVADLDDSFPREEDVFRLQVSVDDVWIRALYSSSGCSRGL